MRVALAQLNFTVGDLENNYRKIETALSEAVGLSADIIAFPELALTGYPPLDFLDFEEFISGCDKYLDQIAATTADKDIAVIVGAPLRNKSKQGKRLYNAGYFIAGGKIEKVIKKTLLPTYDVFDENRYFQANSEFEIIEYKGVKIALTICEDLWNLSNQNPLYTICPMDKLIEHQPDLMINIAASPFDYLHADNRVKVLRANVDHYGIPLLYVNHTGAQTEIIFDGGSIAIQKNGVIADEFIYFKEVLKVFDLYGLSNSDTATSDQLQQKDQLSLIHDSLILGIRDYFGKLGFQTAILGLSGGIDSAVTLALVAEALGPQNVRVLSMPSRFSSQHSVDDSIEMAGNLGVKNDVIPIQSVFEATLGELQPYFPNVDFDVTEENIQARIRSLFLMAFSNKFGNVLLNTSNKSEAAVGYGTLYGDMAGGLSVLGDVYKMQVYQLAEYINQDKEIIPRNIITKPPSAELRPDQKDSDSLPEYDILDQILFEYIENRKGASEIVKLGFEEHLVKRILKMVNSTEFKRKQAPPVLRISPKAFGMGRRLPIVGRYLF